MADDPSKRKTPAPVHPALGSVTGGFDLKQIEEITRSLGGIQAGFAKGLAGLGGSPARAGATVARLEPKEEPRGEVTGGDDEPKRTRRPRKPSAGLTVHGGRREMKAYTVTEDQLESLGAMQVSTTISFSAASALVTFWIGVQQDLAFADATPASTRGWWEGLATGALVLAALLFGLGVWQFIRGRTTIGKIKKETRHD